VSSISGETGGLSESDPPPLRGPLLWESRPEVSGDTSYVQVQTSEARKLVSLKFSTPVVVGNKNQSCNRSSRYEHQTFVSSFCFRFVLGGGEEKNGEFLSGSSCPHLTPAPGVQAKSDI
jgi:hypothetical protein